MAVRPPWDLRQATLAVLTRRWDVPVEFPSNLNLCGLGEGGSALHLSSCQGSDAS